MPDDKRPEDSQQEAQFDAIAAAAELSEAMAAKDGEAAETGSSDNYIAMLESEIEQLNALVEKRNRQLRAADERATQAQEDVAQAEERLQRASAKELEQRSRALLSEMLDVLDDLDRAIEAARERQGDAPSELLLGVELVHRRFLAALQSRGVSEIAAMGQPFDATVHDAVSMVPVPDAAQDGKVIAVTRNGYLIGDAVLRPAGVVVGKKA
ncbi:MAG: nucleotide exchange factor GrpE [Myxococcales bacterium]|nr:nucleotide exchange factor GrpE [Myxococcales bacterium]